MQTFLLRKNTLPYNLLSHIRELYSLPGRNSGITMPLTTQTKPPIIELPFMVFENAGEKEEKLKFIQSQLADFCPDGMPDTASMKTDPELRMEVERQFSGGFLTICVEPKPVTLPGSCSFLTLQLKVSTTIACFSAHSRIFSLLGEFGLLSQAIYCPHARRCALRESTAIPIKSARLHDVDSILIWLPWT